MAVNGRKETRRRRRRRRHAIIGGTLRLRNEFPVASAPDASEERRHAGVLCPDSAERRLPEGLAEAGEADSNGLRPGRVISVITIMAIVFIAIIAWFVSQMPEK